LLSGRLQACIQAQLEEFLERIDQSGVIVDQIPELLRASLCRHYISKSGALTPAETAQLHKAYAILWTQGSALPPGTLKTDSFADEKNPWPDHVQGLLRRCAVDLRAHVIATSGGAYLEDLEEYVKELVAFRNAVAHGDEPARSWSAGDVRLRMRWATRLARACDDALDSQLVAITGSGW
jgi:hypothetical protein